MKTMQASVEVGQRYEGWGRTWEVTRVWQREGVVDAVDVTDSHRTIRWPLTKFRELTPSKR